MKKTLLWILLALSVAAQAATQTAEGACPVALKPVVQEAKAAHLTAELLTRYHYQRIPLDDALSSRIFDQYLKALDPEKLYFLQSDIDRLAVDRNNLDDAILSEDLHAPFDMFNLYGCRVAEQLAYARSLLPTGFDFQGDESLPIDRKSQPWATTAAQLRDVWRKRVKNDWLRLKLAGQSDPAIARVLDKRYESALKRVANIKSTDAFQVFMNAYTEAIEPHTNYLSPRAAQDFDISMRLSLVGIGAVLMDIDGYPTIRELVAGGPAILSGQLAPGDRIVGVSQGAAGPMTEVVGWRLDDTVAVIRGAADSIVRLEIVPAGNGPDAPNRIVTLKRKTITMQDQAAKAKIFSVTEASARRRIGVITLPSFYQDAEARAKGDKNYRSASRDVARLLADMKAQKVDSVLVDLRTNGGGSLQEAIDLTGLFVGKGPVVQVRNAQGSIEVQSSDTPGPAWDGPLGVLINRGSASASEIFAAAIQDYGRGLIIGDPSFGKGTVQTVASLDKIARNDKPEFGDLKMTIAQFFRVNGGTTQLRGVTPDIRLPGTIDAADYGESSFDNALPWSQIKAADYAPVGSVKGELPALSKQHERRVGADVDYQGFLSDIARAQDLRKLNVISLNEVARRKERVLQEKRLASMQGAGASGQAQPAASALADDGLQANERELGKSLAAEKSQKAFKDVLLNEAVSILADEVALKRGQSQMAKNPLSGSPVVVMELPAPLPGLRAQ
ncbi:MAG: carboxy terminal-processing peptidase [Burkholderiaceae bacterium]|nr:carboxy terminal-processing peptidase [Burkholderiaceae bacterium]